MVGLGNPGPAYEKTRHNLGFRVIDALGRLGGVAFVPSGAGALVGAARVRSGDCERIRSSCVWLCKPMTFMNRSGTAVRALLDKTGLPLERMLAVVDDFQLPLGRLRIRARGTDGGHHGLASLAESLGSEDWPRLRIGIESIEVPAGPERVEWVLDSFEEAEEPLVAQAVTRAARLVLDWVVYGLEYCQNAYHGTDKEPCVLDPEAPREVGGKGREP
ncbi:MAG: aminoacyl-tRNA hydrolase [Planctomycetota bacterium]